MDVSVFDLAKEEKAIANANLTRLYNAVLNRLGSTNEQCAEDKPKVETIEFAINQDYFSEGLSIKAYKSDNNVVFRDEAMELTGMIKDCELDEQEIKEAINVGDYSLCRWGNDEGAEGIIFDSGTPHSAEGEEFEAFIVGTYTPGFPEDDETEEQYVVFRNKDLGFAGKIPLCPLDKEEIEEAYNMGSFTDCNWDREYAKAVQIAEKQSSETVTVEENDEDQDDYFGPR